MQLKNKVTILLASHNMIEVERLCNSVIMIKAGKIVDSGSFPELLKSDQSHFKKLVALQSLDYK